MKNIKFDICIPKDFIFEAAYESCAENDPCPFWVRLLKRRHWVMTLVKRGGSKREVRSACGLTVQDALNNCLKLFDNENSHRYWGWLK